MNEQIATRSQSNLNPFQPQAQGKSALASSDAERQIQEVQAALVIAKRFPRDPVAATDRILNACSRPTLAGQSLYSYSKGGSDITGPSIRLAEAIAQHWGNIQFGVKEVNRGKKDGVGFSEMEAFAWDLETNTRKPVTFVVNHWRDTRKGGYALSDERDIYELTANQAARRLRSCILAIIPGDVTEAAQAQCEETMRASADTSPEAQGKIIAQFKKWGVTKEQIEALIQRRMDAIQPAQVIRLRKIATSLRDGISTADEWFKSVAPTLTLPQEPARQAEEQLSLHDQLFNAMAADDIEESALMAVLNFNHITDAVSVSAMTAAECADTLSKWATVVEEARK